MPDYRAPGVYTDEVPSGSRGIVFVDTTTTAVLGATAADAPFRDPILVTSFEEFERQFQPNAEAPTHLDLAVRGFFRNGGERLYVVGLGPEPAAITEQDMALLNPYDDIRLVAAPGFTDQASVDALLRHCGAKADRFAVLDMAEGGNVHAMITAQRDGGLKPRNSARGRGAVYTPWLRVAARHGDSTSVLCPPSGHICGALGRHDRARGVWTAPANIQVQDTDGMTRAIDHESYGHLNAASINCLRDTAGTGPRIMGTRTLSPPTSEMKYVPVRRTMDMIATSLTRGTAWVVFERNDARTWALVRACVEDALTLLWQRGALYGVTSEQAFFVRCDRTTMTQADIDAGRLVCEIGVALLRPAEFLTLRIVHQTGAAQGA